MSGILTTFFGTYPGIQKVWDIYKTLIAKFGNQYSGLINASQEELSKIVNRKIAEAILRVREEKAKVIPGYAASMDNS